MVTMYGKVYGQDSTTVVPGCELLFSNKMSDSAAQIHPVISFLDGNYRVKMLAGYTYRVILNKDGVTIGNQDFEIVNVRSDTSSIVKNFYVKYSDGCCVDYFLPTFWFDTNRSVLRPESMDRLNSIIKQYPAAVSDSIVLVVEGHAEWGEAPRNQSRKSQYLSWLAMERAKSACAYLRKKGVDSSKLFVISYGERHPAAPNTSPENRQLNRRVEVRPVSVHDVAWRFQYHAIPYKAVVGRAKTSTARKPISRPRTVVTPRPAPKAQITRP
ncbi:OmpA family protein [Hymenobacter terrigena]